MYCLINLIGTYVYRVYASTIHINIFNLWKKYLFRNCKLCMQSSHFSRGKLLLKIFKLVSNSMAFISNKKLVQPLSRSHSALDVKRADVLPMLLQQRNQEVDGQMNVLHQLVFIHRQISDGNTQAQNLKE